MTLPLELVTDPAGAEFRSLLNRLGRRGAIRVARADLGTLADYLDQRFGLPPAGTVEERLSAAIQVMADREEIQARYLSNHDHLATYCERAGITYERIWFDGERWLLSHRCVPLFRSVEPNGFLRTLTAVLPRLGSRSEDFRLVESFSDPATAHPDDIYTAYGHTVWQAYEDFGPVADLLEARFGLPHREHVDDRAATILTGLAERGELGPDLPPGANGRRFADWCREAGARPRLDGRTRTHVLRTGEPVLEVAFWPHFGPSPFVRFTEAYRTGDLRHGGTQYHVDAPLDDLPRLVEEFERRLGLEPATGRADDRFIACLEVLVARIGLLSRQGSRALVAEWITASGVTPTVTGFARTEQLVHVHRSSTDCIYELVLTMDATAEITFAEKYEYLPQAGDAGREYSYGVRTPYASLAALVAYLGGGAGEEGLTRGFRALVADGTLTAELGLEEARDRVAEVFRRAGVPAELTDSHWINSD
ncbi:hypothetical protein [Actinoplanes friuliensis]|uniref:Uncharacterized protein n=1 Tax=Actinoplanes friuliensis DSM 7358 TaxID=1246995 RepID=U5VXJ7_9ACTN|nr:hypothetical protein [Actinoplanes friuliensis]AGZ41569.1 hypothetical protein AFR_16435 [Actinoplanes friuliensis DSM 7358]